MLSHQTAIRGQSSSDPPLTGCRHCRPWPWLGSNCLPQTKPKNQKATVAPHLANSPNPPFQTDPQTKPENQTQPQPPYQSQNQRWKKPSVVVFKANLVLWLLAKEWGSESRPWVPWGKNREEERETRQVWTQDQWWWPLASGSSEQGLLSHGQWCLWLGNGFESADVLEFFVALISCYQMC